MAGMLDLMHWIVSGWGGAQGVLAWMGVSALCIGMGLDALSALYTAYNRACIRLEDESWLRNNCRDPVFFSKMRTHSTICSDVEANARLGAFWAAMREVSDNTRAFLHPLAIHATVVVVVSVFFIPLCCLCTQRLGIGHARRLRGLPVHHRPRMCLKDV